MTTYRVHVSPTIAATTHGQRRRCGSVFGQQDVLISAEAKPPKGVTRVQPEQLQAILDDPHLVSTEVLDDPPPEPKPQRSSKPKGS